MPPIDTAIQVRVQARVVIQNPVRDVTGALRS